MKVEKYYCDKCKKETDKKTMQTITIKIGTNYATGCRHFSELELCPACAEKLGVIKRVIKGDKVVNEPQDIKDRLFDVVQEIICEGGVQIEY